MATNFADGLFYNVFRRKFSEIIIIIIFMFTHDRSRAQVYLSIGLDVVKIQKGSFAFEPSTMGVVAVTAHNMNFYDKLSSWTLRRL